MALIELVTALPESVQRSVPTIVTISALYLSWRLWRFSISPALHPNQPRPLPYLVPFFGHIVSMAQNAGAIFTRGREYFGNTREIFTVTVMGEDMYIATSPGDVVAVYRDTQKLDFDAFIKDIMHDFGCTNETLEKMFDSTGKPKHWMDKIHDDFKLQMHPGDRLKSVETQFLGNIDRLMNFDSIPGTCILESTRDSKLVSLWSWTWIVLAEAATQAFFGDGIFQVAPSVLDDFWTFNLEAWKIHSKYPRFAAPKAFNALERSVAAFVDYLRLPKGQRPGACWLVEQLERVCKICNINTNAYRQCFWCLSYLLHDKTLLDEIKKEMQPAWKHHTVDLHYLLNMCPLLASFYEEMLRVNNEPVGIRLVASSVIIGGKELQPGRKLLMPYKQLHMDPSVFGTNVDSFDARRFMNEKSLERSTSWRPFGGAKTHCPGRFLARREVYMFLALAIFRFDVKLVPGPGENVPRFPRADTSIPAGGLLPPKIGDDVFMEVRRSKL
ncbi:hypothetical protein J7T55_007741 [Diaporthe amygdali]|uniref:uncharacterized protein n=1 Tax=Phomopsis amygdali TaxID=1214568 RepID=UPI0022FEEB64|nr:uncharacterized protein J7T55_007741 [Diaporthe amygdali]KAJ0107551.1 hypothetical protein J7T55_007741 [Diaporthe amygdali]